MSGLRFEKSKLFVKTLDSLTGRHSRWEIWKDMIVMFATTISNAVDAKHRESRETIFRDVAKKYNEEEMGIFAQLYAQAVNAMEIGHQDFFGDIFMELGLGNDRGGQFFTPYNLCKAMAKMSLDKAKERIEQNGYISIQDPACGAGATLIAAADFMFHEERINYQQSAMFVGQEIDYTTALMCYIQLSLFGCAGYVHIGNTLTAPLTGHVLFGDGGENTWYTPMYFSPIWDMRRQAVVMQNIFASLEKGEKKETPEALPEPEVQPEPAVYEPVIIQVSGKQARRKPKGQLMLEI